MDETCNNAELMLMYTENKVEFSNINLEYSTDVLTQKYFVSNKKIESGAKSIKNFCKIL